MNFWCCESRAGRCRYPYHKQGARWLRMWTASQKFCLSASECRIYQRGAHPIPSTVSETKRPELSAHTSLPSHCSPFSTSPTPISLYVQLAAPQRLCLQVPNDPQTPTCFVLLIFPLPRDKSLDAKIKTRKGWRKKETWSRGRWGRAKQCVRTGD